MGKRLTVLDLRVVRDASFVTSCNSSSIDLPIFTAQPCYTATLVSSPFQRPHLSCEMVGQEQESRRILELGSDWFKRIREKWKGTALFKGGIAGQQRC